MIFNTVTVIISALILTTPWSGYLSREYVVKAEAPDSLMPFKAEVTLSGAEIITVVTGYSEIDSCHFRVEGGCLTASGKVAQEGMVACNKRHKFGTKFLIENKTYICEDRYNEKLDAKRGAETVDIFKGYGQEAYQNALSVGNKKQIVKIIE